ncbi:MAG: heme exporter protein D [Oceanicoccus sp.]|jgi:heme exporter protein D
MQFDSFSALIAMDGHGVYVWSVYGITFVILMLLIINPLLKNRRFMLEQSMKLRRDLISSERKAKQSVEDVGKQ